MTNDNPDPTHTCLREGNTVSDEVPTIDELRAFLHRQIAEVRATGQREGEDVTDRVDEMLEKLHNIEETHAFIEQTIGDPEEMP